jgi:hypothetical protein
MNEGVAAAAAESYLRSVGGGIGTVSNTSDDEAA